MAAEETKQAGRPRKRILVVDDHADNVEVLRARLDAKGYDVATASGGEEALKSVAASAPDLILLDVMMPQVDGKEVARRIKSDHRLPFIPIIMQTALDSTQDRVEGLDAGADDYITKPINFSELEARIRSMLRIKALQDDLEQRERELEDMNQRLRKMAETDGLTGVDNRRYLEERLHEMLEHSTRLQEPLVCVMCDIDHFKSVNDTHGHQAGDAVLKEFAGLLRDHAREIDRVGRYGGEEFVILLPGTVMDEGVTFAERLRHAVESHTFRFGGGTVRRTMSCGVAVWPHTDLRREDDLLRAADDALYAAKELGRNRVVRFGAEEFKALIGEWKADVEAVGDRPASSRPATPSRGSPAAQV
ncbi:MAG TPA: diguanylate cyclase [Gemmatimonadaceae bacterium]